MTPAVVWTAGHSTLAIEGFLEVLAGHDIRRLVDVRRYAASRRHPQFNASSLADALQAAGIGYTQLPALGGRRDPAAESPNAGWREPGFRGYADYMASEAFASAMQRLLDLAAGERTAILCAEKDWRGCHRGLIAD